MNATNHDLIGQTATPFRDSPDDYDEVINFLGEARLVLLGGSTHGTSEFYLHRAEITKRLLSSCDFTAVAIEADWPDAYRVNRFVQLAGQDDHADDALSDFVRFPSWMWRNHEVEGFVTWLRGFNASLPPRDRVGFYGLDLYSLYGSMAAVLHYLERVDPAEASATRLRYSGFPSFGGGPQSYGYAALATLSPEHQTRAVDALVRLQERSFEYTREHGLVAHDAQFCAEQNARVVIDAERYYQGLFNIAHESWNMREHHMFQTLLQLFEYLESSRKQPAKIVVWAHNLHIGDASATERARCNEVSLGQLANRHFGNLSQRIGFTTSTGTVAAARYWNGAVGMHALQVPLAGSIEELLSMVNIPEFFLPFLSHQPITQALTPERLERAIGTIYNSDVERNKNYLKTHIAKQFNALIHVDYTHAVTPLEPAARITKELPETFPTGF